MRTSFIFLFLLITLPALYHALPLSTSSRWIVDDSTGKRVKLRCVNWAGHVYSMLPEGLDRKPVTDIARHVAAMGFNCVRLTYANDMVIRYSDLSVGQSLANFGLGDAISGLIHHNPSFFNMTLFEAQRTVIEELGAQGVMVELDNQVSKPMWCCSDNDGNGFFGDEFFDPIEWLQGLTKVAKYYLDTPTVIGMSLRNELRGPRQGPELWYKYMSRGAETIHSANPNVLIFVTGLNYAQNFTFLKEKPFKVNVNNKIVYEAHRYASGGGGSCEGTLRDIDYKMGFLTDGKDRAPAPVMITEFGIDTLSNSTDDNLFIGCFIAYLANSDMDWAVWALQSSYYLRDGKQGPGETYSMLEGNWTSLRSPVFYNKLQLIQQQLIDPNATEPSRYVMFHPWTGNCINTNNNEEVIAGTCSSMSRWDHKGDKSPVRLHGTDLCLSAVGDGLPVTLTTNCTAPQSSFEFVPGAEFQLASKDVDGTYLCLDLEPDYSTRILTKKCSCSSNADGCQHNSQWFKLVSVNT